MGILFVGVCWTCFTLLAAEMQFQLVLLKEFTVLNSYYFALRNEEIFIRNTQRNRVTSVRWQFKQNAMEIL